MVFQRHFLIGFLDRSAFSGTSRKRATSVIGSALGFGFPAEVGGRGLGRLFPDACYAGGRGLGGVRLGGGGRRRRTSRKGEGERGSARRLRRRRSSHRAAPDPGECWFVLLPPPPPSPPGPSDKGRKEGSEEDLAPQPLTGLRARGKAQTLPERAPIRGEGRRAAAPVPWTGEGAPRDGSGCRVPMSPAYGEQSRSRCLGSEGSCLRYRRRHGRWIQPPPAAAPGAMRRGAAATARL